MLKSVKIDEQGYWQYVIVEPTFGTGKKMPFEIGYIAVKGYLMEREIYHEILYKMLEDSLIVNTTENLEKIQKY